MGKYAPGGPFFGKMWVKCCENVEKLVKYAPGGPFFGAGGVICEEKCEKMC